MLLFLLLACHELSNDTKQPSDIDRDGDGYSEDAGDCEDDDEAVSPDASETCDGIDNNCDGETDEGAGSGAVYDAADGFSSTANPNGVWSYGWSTALSSAITLYTHTDVVQGVDTWDVDIAPSNGLVAHNDTAETVVWGGSAEYIANQLSFHPGDENEYAHIVFTAPEGGGSYDITVRFTGIDLYSTTSDVHVSVDGASVFDDTINGYGDTVSYTSAAAVSLAEGSTIDFAVGYGTNLNFYNDATGVDAQIISVSAEGCD